MNRVILIGHLGNNPELRYTASNTAVVDINLATTDGWGDKKKTNWHRITAFGKLAEVCGEYLKKGKQVAFEGRIEYQEYEKDGETKYVTKIIAAQMEMLGGKPGGNQEPKDEDIPF